MATTTKSSGRNASKTRSAKGEARTAKPARKGDSGSRIDLRRPVWMWVGAVALAGDTVGHFVDEALKRGEEIEARARKRNSGKGRQAARGKTQAAKRERRSGPRNNHTRGAIAEYVLGAFDIPSKADLNRLEKKVDDLTRKQKRSTRTQAPRRARATASPAFREPARSVTEEPDSETL